MIFVLICYMLYHHTCNHKWIYRYCIYNRKNIVSTRHNGILILLAQFPEVLKKCCQLFGSGELFEANLLCTSCLCQNNGYQVIIYDAQYFLTDPTTNADKGTWAGRCTKQLLQSGWILAVSFVKTFWLTSCIHSLCSSFAIVVLTLGRLCRLIIHILLPKS